MKRMRRTQEGYGVMVPDEYVPRNTAFSKDDGLYITDTETGECKLLASINDVFEKASIDKSAYKDLEVYGFHCKYNPQGDRIMFSMRGIRQQPLLKRNTCMIKDMDYWVVTLKPDASEISLAIPPEEWSKQGHHTNWMPDGKRLSMNLAVDGIENGMFFMQVDYDGTNYKKIHNSIEGSGHPTVHPNGRHILTDTYAWESKAFGDGTVPLRFIDIKQGTEKTAVRINVAYPPASEKVGLRIDPHPAWSPDFRYVAFNGYLNGARRVFVADFEYLLKNN